MNLHHFSMTVQACHMLGTAQNLKPQQQQQETRKITILWAWNFVSHWRYWDQIKSLLDARYITNPKLYEQ